MTNGTLQTRISRFQLFTQFGPITHIDDKGGIGIAPGKTDGIVFTAIMPAEYDVIEDILAIQPYELIVGDYDDTNALAFFPPENLYDNINKTQTPIKPARIDIGVSAQETMICFKATFPDKKNFFYKIPAKYNDPSSVFYMYGFKSWLGNEIPDYDEVDGKFKVHGTVPNGVPSYIYNTAMPDGIDLIFTFVKPGEIPSFVPTAITRRPDDPPIPNPSPPNPTPPTPTPPSPSPSPEPVPASVHGSNVLKNVIFWVIIGLTIMIVLGVVIVLIIRKL